jgi:hypothetical protein
MALDKRSGLFVLFLSVAGLLPVTANAGLLGSDLGWQYYAGGGALPTAVGDVPVPGSVTSGSFIDSGGLGGEFIEPTLNDTEPDALPVFDIYADDTTITFDYSVSTPSSWSSSPLSLTPTIYNGIAINLLSAGSFASVSIDSATNMVDFDASDLSFTDDQIQVNWADLDFDTSTVVTLDVTYSEISAVPEPGTCSLIIPSLLSAGLAVSRRGRNKPSAT